MIRMKNRMLCILLCLVLCPLMVSAEELSFFDEVEADSVGKIVRTYDSDTLMYTMEKFLMEGELCYLTRVWVQDPDRQIRKATAEWEKGLNYPDRIAAGIPGATLAINGSGFVSPEYPGIPDNYPGKSKDYFYTPLGSLTVTDGEVFRNLEGVPYYGLTLDADGLQMYTGMDNEEVLATKPAQTWSFYVQCPLMRNNEDLLPREWDDFRDKKYQRTIIARVDRNNYLILTATRERGKGITLRTAVEFFRENFRTEWVYNLDGGPSSALMSRLNDKKNLRLLTKKGAKVTDVMVFTE